MLRNATLRRAIASFFLLEMAASLAAPRRSYALTGPGQPEFTSYESASSSDMVNLSTGDLTYNLPVLEVPGPETTFSLPLTYRAGIRTEQEASWVGLGWGMNPGTIVRNVNGYPDDASGELATNSFSDPGSRGWYGGVPGILQLGWDSETGHSGSASLLSFVNASWSGGKLQHGDLIGIGATRGEGFTVDVATVVSVGSSIVTAGASTAISAGAKIALQAGGAVAAGVGIAAFGKSGRSGGGFNRPTIVKDHTWFRTNYWVFSNDTTKEAMYGSLYFDRLSREIDTRFGGFDDANNYGPNVYDGQDNYAMGKSRKGYKFKYLRNYGDQGNFATETAADMQRPNSPYTTDYKTNAQNPLSIAHDDFQVMGPGISGSIRPQRLDAGSLATPRQMLAHHDKYSLVPWQSYKVPFRYESTASNTYTYAANTNPATAPGGVDGSNWGQSHLILTDPKLYDPTQNAAAARTEANRKGLTDLRLAQGKQVNWFTNKEIADAYDSSPATRPIMEVRANVAGTSSKRVLVGYTTTRVDHQVIRTPNYVTQSVSSQNLFRRLLPENGIGAFAVTAEDGTTYHYSLPVYHYRQYARTGQLENGVEKGVAIGRTGATGTANGNYATAWLLTAITSPDYVDQGTIGVVDDQDLGTWVTFSYGKFSAQFKWRQPYVGTEQTDQGLQNGVTTSSQTFQEGAQETYYLNAIRTRTHSALFIKSARRDGRGHYGAATTATTSNLGIDERTPASSLRLDEIVVLSNQDLKDLQADTGFSENTSNNATSTDTHLGTGDSFAAVYDSGDISPGIRATLNQKALKRVVFNYSYRLCPGTPNSFANPVAPPTLGGTYDATGRLGKLTLESIATYGSNSVKIIPDFTFDYGFNPAYNPVKRDGFGMYSSTGSATNYLPSNNFVTASQDGAAWSLTKLTNPLGAVTEIAYERDQYSSVSENSLGYLTLSGGDRSPQFSLYAVLSTGIPAGTGTKLSDFIHPGDVLAARGSIPNCANSYCTDVLQGPIHVQSVVNNDLTIAASDIPPATCTGSDNTISCDGTLASSIVLTDFPLNRNGGDIRVARLSTVDEAGHRYQTKYQYTVAATVDQRLPTSSGVISKEPERIRGVFNEYAFYNLFDYPATPVMYGQVSILRGNFTTPDDIDQREEYSFYTPTSDMIQVTNKSTETSATYPFLQGSGRIKLRQQDNEVTVNLGLLGQAKSIRKFNRRGTLEYSTVFNYGTNLPNADGVANQGVYAEGGLTSEFLDVDNTAATGATYNINWTTKAYLPTTLLSTTTTTNNIAATTTNTRYDFYSGAVLETSLLNSLGDRYRTQTVPAYTVYPGMGPKTEMAGNRHMLTQTAATYAYKENGTARPAVLGAGIQTWKGDWTNYRLYDPATDTYKADPAAEAPIWRQHRTYAWQSPKLNADGTFANFVAYDWTTPAQAANWLNVGEVTRYDHFSRPLESKDLNGQYSAQKAGYDQSLTLAAAGNARYTEIAYSGAEEVVAAGTTPHFGGEVRDGGRQSAAQHHTGQFSSLLTATNPLGFTYKATVGNDQDLSTDRTYRASVWVHNSDADGSARLYVALNGTTLQEVNRLDASTKRAGDWYLLKLLVDLPASAAGQQLTVGCRRAGSSDVYVDDFRFQPLDAPLQASVYDPATRQLRFTLDNDNLFTRYQYDAAGKIVKVLKEVLTPTGSTAPAERLVQESSYNYARMREPTWVRTSLVDCEVNADGSPTGYGRYQRQDMNSSSPTYNQFDWVRGEATADCPTCTGYLARWLGGKCEFPTRLGCVSSQFYRYDPNCTPVYRNTYTFQYSDGSSTTGDVEEANPCAPLTNPVPTCP